MKRNIFIFNEYSPAGDYGIGTYLSQLQACRLPASGYEFHIIHLSAPGTELRTEQQGETYFYYIPQEQVTHSQNRDRYYRNVVLLLKNYRPKQQAPIFLINYFRHDALMRYLKEQYPDSTLVFTLHALGWTFQLYGNRAYFQDIVSQADHPEQLTATEQECLKQFKTETETLNRADRIICLCRSTYQLLITAYQIKPSKLFLIPNGLDDQKSASYPEIGTTLRRQFFIRPDEKIILYVGRWSRLKGSQELLSAFRKVVQQIPECRLLIAGGEKDFMNKAESIEPWTHITYTGPVSRALVHQFYEIADLGVLPSFSEQCSFVAIEMMQHGLPIVGTDAGGLCEMIEDGENGYKIPLRTENQQTYIDTQELADKMISVLQKDKTCYQRLCEGSRKRYENHFTLEKMTNRLLQMFNTL